MGHRTIVADRHAKGRLRRIAARARTIAAGTFLIAVFVGVLVTVVRYLPQLLASPHDLRDAKDRAEELGRTRTAVLAVFAGGLAVVGAYYGPGVSGSTSRSEPPLGVGCEKCRLW